MALRILALMTVCVFVMGCGMDGPVPNDNKNAAGSPGSTIPSSTAAGNSSTQSQTGMAALDAKDAPYVQGKIIVNGPSPDEWLTAGFVGKGADGKRYSNGAVGKFSPGSNAGTTSSSHGPQLTSVFGNGQQGVGYRHVKMPPGEYLIFVERNCVKLAWKKVTVKPGDQLTVDLTIDPAKSGSLVVTWTYKNRFNNDNRPLALNPVELDNSDLIPSDTQPLVFVKNGVDTITLTGVPAGKYHVQSSFIGADVEVKPGSETHVTLGK